MLNNKQTLDTMAFVEDMEDIASDSPSGPIRAILLRDQSVEQPVSIILRGNLVKWKTISI